MTARTRWSGAGRSRSSASYPEACAACAALVVVLAASGCGGSARSDPGAVCGREAAVVRRAAPHDLSTGADALKAAIRVDRELARRPQLAARARRAAARASATLAEIRQTDQRALMTPLRTGVPGARRALADTRALLREACQGQASRR